MQKLELFDETFDPDRTESYELSIQVSLSGFSFCIKDLVRNYFIGLVSCPFELGLANTNDWSNQVDFIKKQYPWLKKTFKKVTFSFESQSFCLAPKELFEPEHAKQLLSLTNIINELDEVRYSETTVGKVCVFNLPTQLVASWAKVQPKSKIVGFCEPVLQYHELSLKQGLDSNLTISFANDFSIIAISKGTKLLHCGSIESHSIEDTLYHMVNMCKQLDLTPAETQVSTMGYIEQAENMEALIERFFKGVSIATTLEQNHFSYLLVKYKGRFANLFNQSLCE